MLLDCVRIFFVLTTGMKLYARGETDGKRERERKKREDRRKVYIVTFDRMTCTFFKHRQ